MMIVVTLIIFLLSIVRYKKTVMFSTVVLMFMNNLSSGIEGVKLFYLVSLCQIVLFYVFGYNRRTKIEYPHLILIPTLLASICYIISSFVGEMHQYAKNVVNIAAWFWFPFIVWHILESKKDIICFSKIFFLFFLVVGLYAIVELVLGYNIYSQWASSVGIIAGELGGLEADYRFGFLKCNSLLPFTSTLGMAAAFVFYVSLIFYIKKIYLPPYSKILFFLLPFCVLLSGSRSSIVVLTICLAGLFLGKEYAKSRVTKAILILGGLLLFCFSAFFFTLMDSILHSDTSSSAEGSSIEMRLQQFAVTDYYWRMSPLFGHGRNFTWEVAIPDNSALLGAESIIFTQLIDHGLVGLLTFYLIGICLAIWCWKFSKPLSMLPIAFITGKTTSTFVAVEYNVPIILCFLVVKSLIIYRKENRAYQRNA